MLSKLRKILQSFLLRVKSSSFVRDVLMVGGGIALAQAISLAFMPLLTRLYGPESFGIAASFAAILNIITPISTMGYANAIVMPESDEDASAVARLSISIALFLIPITSLAVFLGKPWLAQWTGMQQSPNMLYLIPVSLIITAFLSVANQSAIRAQLFKPKARAYVESILITNINKLLGGLVAPSGLMLITLTILGSLTNFIFQILRVPRQGVLKPSNWLGLRGTLQAAKTQKDFAVYRMPQSVINITTVSLPVIILTSFFGPSSAGQYSLAALILGAPSMLLGQAVGEVFYPKITRAITNHDSNAYKILLKVSLTLACVGILPFGFIFFFGEWALSIIFGEEWRLAGQYSRWLSLWLFSTLISGASVAAIPALGLQRFLLIREFLSVILRVAALYIGFKMYNSDMIAIKLFSFAGVALSLLIIYTTINRLHKNVKQWNLNNS